jgi:CheY-like chemotaxis protein
MQAKVLDLNSIVADMDKMLRRLIGEDVDLLTLLKSGLGQINADPGQMEQVLMNLVVNARDAMLDGGKITIETGNVELGQDYATIHASVRPGRYVFLAVSDTGIGMDGALQKRVFDPFFTTKEVGKGTGLGLSTVYGIVKQSGGNIWLYSEPGIGTTFKVYLPRVDEAVDQEIECELLGIPQRTETILLVEDEEIVRTMTRQILEMSGHKVLEAACGSEAIRICGSYEGPVHLMLTDVVMPLMNGPSLVKEVMRIRPDIKTLFMSGYTDNAILRHGILEEGMPFLQKPFSPDGLALKVRDVLNS